MSESVLPKRWWLAPLLFTLGLFASITLACILNETAREIFAKSFFTIAGALATPFILETSFALFGLVVVLVFNEYRRLKDGPEWVELEVPDKNDSTGSDQPGV